MTSTGGDDPTRLDRGDSQPEPEPEPPPLHSRESTPERLGRYLVIEELGRGGMGVVLRAYDPRLQREIALKVLLAQRRTDEARARMVREARAMAKLNHPNVVAVYDVETDADGRITVAMEYVAGTTLGQWLERSERPWAEILEAFVAAGTGLLAAHREGLLHRDFKLDNVLVGHDQRVRVTDFGLARLAEAAITEHPEHPEDTGSTSQDDDSFAAEITRAGTVVGTLRYMAPEQLMGSSLTEAVDQYAFCVSLWRALTGEWPHPQSGRALSAAKLQPPPAWPRGSRAPRRVGEALRRGLSPEPEQRWPTMHALLEVLERARGRRQRRGVMLVLGSTAILGAAAAWGPLFHQDERCTGAREQLAGVWDRDQGERVREALVAADDMLGQPTWERIEPQLHEYAETWVAQHTEACEATTVRGEQSSTVLDLRMACLRQARSELGAVAQVLGAADSKVLLRAHGIVDGLPPLRRCAEVEALTSDVSAPPPELAEAVEAAHAELAGARVLLRAGRYDEALASFEALLSRARTLGHEPLTAETLVAFGRALSFTPQSERALELLREAQEASLAARAWAGAREAATRRAFVLGELPGRTEEAFAFAEVAHGLLSVVPDDDAQADLHNVMGSIWRRAGRHDRAEAEHRAALEILLATRGPKHSNVSVARNNLGNALHDQGRYDEAAIEHREALAIRIEALGENHPYVADSRLNLGNALTESEHYDEAEAEYRAALALQEARLGSDHPSASLTRLNLSSALNGQGRREEAKQVIRRALEGLVASRGEEHMITAIARFNLATILRDEGKLSEAEAELRRIIEVQRGVLDETHPELARFRGVLAELLLERDGTSEEVRALAEAAWTAKEHAAVPPLAKGYSAFVLARALASEPDLRERARQLAQRAIEAYDEAESVEGRKDVETWLRSLDGPASP